MNIGKREQIVIGSIVAILLIVVLHLFIFGPSAASFQDAKNSRDSMAQQISGLSTIPPNSKILADFEKKTSDYLSKLDNGLKRLKMDEPECFILPKIEEVKAKPGEPALPPYVAPSPTPAPVPGKPTPTPNPDDPRQKRFQEVLHEKFPAQLDMIFGEIAKLRETAKGRSILLSFLGANQQYGWNVSFELPPAFQSSVLWDQLKNIATLKSSMDRISRTHTEYPQILQRYMYYLGQLGLDLYQSERLARFGDFVPNIQRLFLAELIWQKKLVSPNPVIVESEELTQEKLLHYLSIDLPLEPLDGLTENRFYFVFEYLRNLNALIETAQRTGVKDVTAVTLRGFGYLRESGSLEDPSPTIQPDPDKLLDDELDDKAALAASASTADGSGASNPGMMMGGNGNGMGGAGMGMGMGMGMGGGMSMGAGMGMGTGMESGNGMSAATTLNLQSTARQTGDLGYVVPIRLSIVAPNANGMAFLYEVLRENPMTELHRLILRSTAVANRDLTVQWYPASTDVEFTPTFLFIPKLFDTTDTVRKMIDELRAKDAKTSATATASQPPVR